MLLRASIRTRQAKMRFVAIVPVLLSIAALILTFLAMFAGHKPGFMEDYAVITVSEQSALQTVN